MAICTVTISTNRCLTHYLGNSDSRTRRNGRSAEGVRLERTESRPPSPHRAGSANRRLPFFLEQTTLALMLKKTTRLS